MKKKKEVVVMGGDPAQSLSCSVAAFRAGPRGPPSLSEQTHGERESLPDIFAGQQWKFALGGQFSHLPLLKEKAQEIQLKSPWPRRYLSHECLP